MGNCACKIEVTEYVKICGKTEIDLLPNTCNWEEPDEEIEQNYLSILETESDDNIENDIECKGYCNVFDEIMGEHPEWFLKLQETNSEWDIIDAGIVESSSDTNAERSLDQCERDIDDMITVECHSMCEERVMVQEPSSDGPWVQWDSGSLMKNPMLKDTNENVISSFQNSGMKGMYTKLKSVSGSHYYIPISVYENLGVTKD